MSFLSLVLYIPLQLGFIPLALLGASLVAYRQLVISKKLGVSQTAIEVLNGRWTMHVFGIRIDDATAKLATALPNTSLTGLWLAFFPLWLKYRISGKLFLYPRVPEAGAEGLRDLIVSRTLYFDRIIERVIGEVEQFVVMGAGYDTRAYGDLQEKGLALFELDQASVQKHKQNALAEAGISCEHVRFVSVDFSKENAFDNLSEAGFDRTRKRSTIQMKGLVSACHSPPITRTHCWDLSIPNRCPWVRLTLWVVQATKDLSLLWLK